MRRSFARKLSLAALAAAATAGFSSAAFAHVGDHSHMVSSKGLRIRFSGLDHMLAMVAVGLWASQLGRPAIWLLPLTFPVVMAVGAAFGISGVALPWVEIGIAGFGAGARRRGGAGAAAVARRQPADRRCSRCCTATATAWNCRRTSRP